MPVYPDPLQDADYRALVDALAREGLPRRAEAARAVEAVMCALSQRIAHADLADLLELLPFPFRTRLAACERHAVAPHPRFRTAEDFYEVVAEDLDRSPEEVEPTVRAVFAAVRAQIPEGDAEDVGNQLPSELQVLWRRMS